MEDFLDISKTHSDDSKCEHEDSKSFVEQFMDEEGKVWNRNDFYLNSGIDINGSINTSICHVKSESEYAPSDMGEMETSVQRNGKEGIKDEVLELTDKKTGHKDYCTKKTDENDMLPEPMGSTPEISFQNSPRRSYRKVDVVDSVRSHAKWHKCHLCDYSSIRKDSLKVHIARVHLKEKPHKCNFCDYSATQKRSLKSHVSAVHLNEKLYKCHICDYGANHKQSLKIHIDVVHLGTKAHKCDLCDFRTTRSRGLKLHIADIHIKQKPYKCHLCNYSASRKTSLKIHIAGVHMKEKLHKCHLCDYRSSQKFRLNKHIDNVHPEALPYKNDNKATQKSILKVHVDGIQPQVSKCDLYGYTVSQKNYTIHHIQEVHFL